MIVLGLTGSMGMGKSTTAAIFSEAGISVHDSDAAVHDLYSGPDAWIVARTFPNAARGGVIDRILLSREVVGDAEAMKKLERIVHPYVTKVRETFLQAARNRHERVVVLDVPLLFEFGIDSGMHAIIVATATQEIQRERVLARPGMNPAQFDELNARQVADNEKRQRAHFLVHTDKGLESARRQVRAILASLAHLQPAVAAVTS